MSKRARYLALPQVQADPLLLAEHEQLTREGYALEQFIGVRLNRRGLRAKLRFTWLRPATAPNRPQQTICHEIDIDLRKQLR